MGKRIKCNWRLYCENEATYSVTSKGSGRTWFACDDCHEASVTKEHWDVRKMSEKRKCEVDGFCEEKVTHEAIGIYSDKHYWCCEDHAKEKYAMMDIKRIEEEREEMKEEEFKFAIGEEVEIDIDGADWGESPTILKKMEKYNHEVMKVKRRCSSKDLHGKLYNNYRLHDTMTHNWNEKWLKKVGKYKFEVGEKVRVNLDGVPMRDGRCALVPSMMKHDGEQVTIDSRHVSAKDGSIYYRLTDNTWNWQERCLEKIGEKREAKFHAGEQVIARFNGDYAGWIPGDEQERMNGKQFTVREACRSPDGSWYYMIDDNGWAFNEQYLEKVGEEKKVSEEKLKCGAGGCKADAVYRGTGVTTGNRFNMCEKHRGSFTVHDVVRIKGKEEKEVPRTEYYHDAWRPSCTSCEDEKGTKEDTSKEEDTMRVNTMSDLVAKAVQKKMKKDKEEKEEREELFSEVSALVGEIVDGEVTYHGMTGQWLPVKGVRGVKVKRGNVVVLKVNDTTYGSNFYMVKYKNAALTKRILEITGTHSKKTTFSYAKGTFQGNPGKVVSELRDLKESLETVISNLKDEVGRE
jgi:hypothetical protein